MRRYLGPTAAVFLLLTLGAGVFRTRPVDSGWRRWEPDTAALAAGLAGPGSTHGPDSPTWAGTATAAAFVAASYTLSSIWSLTDDGTGQPLTRGYKADGATTRAMRLSSGVTLSTAGASIASFENNTTLKARVDLNGLYLTPIQTVTIADDGAGTLPAQTITPTSQHISCVCNDTNGCTITMGETGVQDGTDVEIISAGTGVCNFADTAGVTELSAAFAAGGSAGGYDSIRLRYLTDRWVEVGRSNN